MNDSNLLNGSNYCKYELMESSIVKTVQLMSCLVLGGFGIFGNVFVIVLAVKYTVTRSLHFLIINMAVADTLFVISQLWRYINNHSFREYSIWDDIGGTVALVLCKALPFFNSLFTTESLVTLLVISIARYRNTRRTVQISRPLSGKGRVIVTAGCWFNAMLMNLHWPIFARIEENDSEKTCAMYSLPNKKASPHIIIVLVHVALLLVYYSLLILLSILTLRRISRPHAIEDSLSEVQRKYRRKRIRNTVKMVLYSLLLYTCCYGPLYVTNIFLHFTDILSTNCIDLSTMSFIAWFFLPLVNSCLSPCIYCVCLSDFREATKRLLCFRNTPSMEETLVYRFGRLFFPGSC